jgi:hypothetical protein
MARTLVTNAGPYSGQAKTLARKLRELDLELWHQIWGKRGWYVLDPDGDLILWCRRLPELSRWVRSKQQEARVERLMGD